MTRRFKKLGVGLILTGVLITTVPHTTYARLNLSDKQIEAPSSWAKADIRGANTIGFVPDEIQGNYRETITREEFSELAVSLYEALSGRKVTVQVRNPFNDTNNSRVVIANQLGIMKGRGEGTFDPQGKITREEVSVVLFNTLKTAKPNNNYEGSFNSGFNDNSKISNWASDAVGYLYGIEVLNGNDDNLFNPKEYTTREESIILGKRIYDRVSESKRTSRGRLTLTREVEIEEEVARNQEPSQKARLQELIAREMGKPYQYGAAGPNSYDCSGLTSSIFGKLGINIARRSIDQLNNGVPVARKDLQYGDLILFVRDGKTINHVGIYVGDNSFVHSPQTGDVVKVTKLERYYDRSYYAARRLIR